MADGAVVVGVDLGTSAVKVLAVTPAGREVAVASEFYGLQTPQPLYVEQDAEAVYRATMRVLARVIADVRLRGEGVAAIGFSAAMHGLLCVDAAGEPISPVLTWMDRRSSEIAGGWRAGGSAAELYRETGAPMHPMLPIAKLRWLAEHEPALFARAHRFVGLKELFIHRWTGEWLIDWGLAGATGMFAFASRTWSERALTLAGVERRAALAARRTVDVAHRHSARDRARARHRRRHRRRAGIERRGAGEHRFRHRTGRRRRHAGHERRRAHAQRRAGARRAVPHVLLSRR